MGGGRQPDKVWKYAEANPNKAEAVKKPYVDVFQKVSHSDNATKFKLFLAFDCPEVMKSKPLEWTELVAGLTEKNVQQRKESDKATRRHCVRSMLQRAAGRASAGEQGSHLPNKLAKTGAYAGSIAAAGLSAAKLQAAVKGAKFMDKYVDSITEAELEAELETRCASTRASWRQPMTCRCAPGGRRIARTAARKFGFCRSACMSACTSCGLRSLASRS